jgi:hypothetical protein
MCIPMYVCKLSDNRIGRKKHLLTKCTSSTVITENIKYPSNLTHNWRGQIGRFSPFGRFLNRAFFKIFWYFFTQKVAY